LLEPLDTKYLSSNAGVLMIVLIRVVTPGHVVSTTDLMLLSGRTKPGGDREGGISNVKTNLASVLAYAQSSDVPAALSVMQHNKTL